MTEPVRERAILTLLLLILLAVTHDILHTTAKAQKLEVEKVQPITPPKRLSGNCGPAAVGLTPTGDVVPIKVDFGGHVIPSLFQNDGRTRREH